MGGVTNTIMFRVAPHSTSRTADMLHLRSVSPNNITDLVTDSFRPKAENQGCCFFALYAALPSEHVVTKILLEWL